MLTSEIKLKQAIRHFVRSGIGMGHEAAQFRIGHALKALNWLWNWISNLVALLACDPIELSESVILLWAAQTVPPDKSSNPRL